MVGNPDAFSGKNIAFIPIRFAGFSTLSPQTNNTKGTIAMWEEERRRMELAWETKSAAREAYAHLRERNGNCDSAPVPVYDGNSIRYFLADAVKTMVALRCQNKRYDVVYIDPPYNTGNKFIGYNDDYSIPMSEFKAEIGKSQRERLSNTEQMERKHRSYLDMMYLSLSLISELLAEDGVLFISIDENELYNLKLLCDEIFGPDCFVAQLNWQKTETPSNLSKTVKRSIEYVLCYANEKKKQRFLGVVKDKKSSNGLMNQSNKESVLRFPADAVSTSLADGMYAAGKYGTPRYDIELLEDCHVENGKFATDVVLKGKFKWSQNKLESELANKDTEVLIASTAFSPSYIRKGDVRETPSNLVDKKVGVGTTETASSELFDQLETTAFDYPKPVSLLSYLLNFVDKERMSVLDCFAGSGSTGIAVLRNNARNGTKWECDLIDSSETSYEVFKRRMAKEVSECIQ